MFLKYPFWTIGLSVFLSLGFLVFVWANRKTLTHLFFVSFSIPLVIGIFALNLPLLRNHSISLTALSPIYQKQDYGRLSKHMPVNANVDDWKTWDRLSTQYFFYPKGLGTHANSRIIYNLAKRFTSFSTDFGIDTEAGNQASVTFVIYGDDKKLFESEVMKRYDNPKHIQVDVTGVTTLMLVVTDAQNGNIDDHADWLNPELKP